MQMSHKYTFESRIRFSEVDHTEKITLPGIINYFQDCSIFQSESIGLGLDYLSEKKRAWILSSWQVEVERYPGLGEEIRVSTWATEFKGILGSRNFSMESPDGEMLAYANSLWVYMDMEKGRPVKPEQVEIERYGKDRALQMEVLSRKVKLPQGAEKCPEFPVRKYHIDTNEHVNNCQYVQMAMEMLEGDREIKRLRAEYKKSAVYKDRIVPYVFRRENDTTVGLCDTTGQAYAVMEFKF